MTLPSPTAGPEPAPNPAIEAVLFDFGGVLAGSPFDAFSQYEAIEGLPSGFIRSINATNRRASSGGGRDKHVESFRRSIP